MEQEDKLKTVSYSGIFLSCFSAYSEKCVHATPEHTLVYLYSGEQVIEDGEVYSTECKLYIVQTNYPIGIIPSNIYT